MSTLIFRNSSVEYLFKNKTSFEYSDYDGIEFNTTYESYIWFYTLPLKFNLKGLIDEIKDYRIRINFILERIPSDNFFYLFTLEKIRTINIIESNFELTKTIAWFNNELLELSTKYTNVKIIDFNDFLLMDKPVEIIDWRYYFLSKSVINPKLSKVFQIWFNDKLRAYNNKRAKCLVLDLDNTLWGGILGEDGIEGIHLNENYPGNVFKRFQEIILELKKSGLILAICSKNNLSDVEELFLKHDEMILSKDDFIIIKANWNDKATNIKEIALELNIGLDSIVFIDDNPTEREIVQSILPQVIVPAFPAKPYEMINFIHGIIRNHFSLYNLTNEDVRKTEQYKENIFRKNMQDQSISMEDYLKNLKIEIDIIEANDINITRLSQLTQKTNQFNLTTQRYNEVDLLAFKKKKTLIYGLSVKDKFGEYGITGLSIIHFLDKVAFIDSFLLSCRILGKGIENEFLNCLINLAAKKSIKKIQAKYISTPKNIQTKEFYIKNGFTLIEDNDNTILYELLIKDYTFNPSRTYKINTL